MLLKISLWYFWFLGYVCEEIKLSWFGPCSYKKPKPQAPQKYLYIP